MTLRLRLEPRLYADLVGWPFALALVGIAVLFVATSALYVRAWGTERRGLDWAFGAGLLTGLGGLGCFVGPIAIAGAVRGADPLACEGCGVPVALAFGLPISGTVAAGTLTAALLALAAARLAFGLWPTERAWERIVIGVIGGLGAVSTHRERLTISGWFYPRVPGEGIEPAPEGVVRY